MLSSLVLSQTDIVRPTALCREALATCLDAIWQDYFIDMPRVNSVFIDYCYPWKGRLGLIRLSSDARETFIGINALLQLQQVPDYVLITTIAHEMVHYSHGFGSPLPRRFKHPHANKVVDKALEQRKMGLYLQSCNEWIDKNWYTFYDMQRASGWPSLTVMGRASKHEGR